ncbi:MAG TPA: glycosyltransferase [Zeimonas sp.]
MASNPIHVLEVLGNAIVGGMETWVLRMLERLPADRFRITALCPFESAVTERLRALDIDTLIVSMPPEDPSWASLQTTCALIQASGVDVLHAHLPNAHMLAALAARMTGKPIITTIHGRQLTTTDLEVHRCTGSRIHAVCRQTYYHALGLGVDADRICYIPNGVDTKTFRPLAERPSLLRDELGIDAKAPLVGFVGRLSPEKGPDLFVRLAAIAHRSAPDAHFVLIGDGPMREEIASRIDDEGLRTHVHLAGLRDDLPRLYAELDLLASTSRSEAMPLALMEGMACGVPIVATRVGAVPDLVVHGSTGFLAGYCDCQSAADAVVELLASPEKRRRMSEASRALALQRFDLDDSVAQVSQLLARLAAPRRAPRPVSAVGADATTN